MNNRFSFSEFEQAENWFYSTVFLEKISSRSKYSCKDLEWESRNYLIDYYLLLHSRDVYCLYVLLFDRNTKQDIPQHWNEKSCVRVTVKSYVLIGCPRVDYQSGADARLGQEGLRLFHQRIPLDVFWKKSNFLASNHPWLPHDMLNSFAFNSELGRGINSISRRTRLPNNRFMCSKWDILWSVRVSRKCKGRFFPVSQKGKEDNLGGRKKTVTGGRGQKIFGRFSFIFILGGK